MRPAFCLAYLKTDCLGTHLALHAARTHGQVDLAAMRATAQLEDPVQDP